MNFMKYEVKWDNFISCVDISELRKERPLTDALIIP